MNANELNFFGKRFMIEGRNINLFFLQLICFGILLFYTHASKAQTTILLNENWEFKNVKDAQWLKATVPGCVHTDLQKLNIIPDPLFGSNESKVHWIGHETWEYHTNFNYNLNFDSAHLCFEGLNTYASVFVNDSLLLETNNMFLKYEVLLTKKMMHPQGNTLRIIFKPSVVQDEIQKKALALELPGAYAYTRKAAYEYGWDWGPQMNTSGLWKPVYLCYCTLPKVIQCNLKQTKLNNEEATLRFDFELNHESKNGYTLELQNLSENKILLSEEIISSKLNPIISLYSITKNIVLPHPKLWWCHGYGDAYQYRFKIILKSENGSVVYDTLVNIGIRKLELIQDKNKEGSSFYFRLNGVNIFCKGANMIPVHSFASNENELRYKKLVDDALAVNMNMLRVWGGGFYPDNSFYNYCDEKGIMVWQDFMFACSVYPYQESFINNVLEETRQQVNRIGNHACIALWCGNNEVDEGWKNWGWQKQFHYSSKDSAKLWEANFKLFNKFIPDILKNEYPESNYWPSSPGIGWGHAEAMQSGDMHYWGVWWGQETFENYIQHTGRFMSEYGFQSLPEMNSLQQFIPADSLMKSSIALKTHQKHPVGFETIDAYMRRLAQPPADLEKYSYFSQWVQANGMRIGIEAHRRKMPYCMGTLYWQLNDCWPAISWSSIDYYGRWKKFHYDLRRLYATYLISATFNTRIMQVFVVSDSINDINAVLHVKLKNIKGEVLYETKETKLIKKLSSQIVQTNNIMVLNTLKGDYYELTLTEGEKILAHCITSADEKKLIGKLETTQLETKVVTEAGISYMLIKNKGTLAQGVFITADHADLSFEDNYFDMQAGEERKILIQGNVNPLNTKFHFLSLNDCVKPW